VVDDTGPLLNLRAGR